ncbi:MAG TPA: glycoside hydrolase family 3 C-terminal domain-containing protein [Anaerolineaceae bacterium]
MENIEELIHQMTLEEKAALCTGASHWTSTPVERLGIPELICSDGPHGVRRQPDVHDPAVMSLPATAFPTYSCLAATWDVDLAYQMGEALGDECIALNVDVLLGPGINMKRSPLNGRNFEYLSEDPYQAGEMATAIVKGVQSKGVGTSVKHYAANNQEFQRFSINAQIDERTLREIYLSAFEKVVKQAQPWTVMCSYNKVNGSFASEHHYLLTEILKKEWGFEGLVVSDWGAVRDRVAALKGGLDWEMPGPRNHHVMAVIEAVRSGMLDEAVLDEAVRRILRIVFKAHKTPKGGKFDQEAHHTIAKKIASEGIVLLKNNGILPIHNPEHIAVIGHSAIAPHFQGGGSSHINPTRVAIPLNEIKQCAGNAEITFSEGYPSDNEFRPDMIAESVKQAQSADIALLFIALPTFKESEGYDRKDMDLTEQQIALIQAVGAAQPNTVVILNNGSPVAMSAWIESCAAVLEAYMSGQAGGAAVVDILFGKTNPCGKLAETFPIRLEDTPATINWPGEAGVVRYGEGLFIGYRYYDIKRIPVQFPFGYGLSYTTFAYSNPQISATHFKDTDGVVVSVDVTNTGNLPGKEIVQVYVHDQKSCLVRPYKELKGFSKVELQPGETKTVSISLDFRSFAFYHHEYKQWITESGKFNILIGASSEDIRYSLEVELESTLNLPCILDKESTLDEWMSDPRGKIVLSPMYPQIEEQSRKRFSGRYPTQKGKDPARALGMADIMDMMKDMPLVSVLMLSHEKLTMPPEDIVDSLLRQAHNLNIN